MTDSAPETNERLVFNASDYFSSLISDINSAQHSVALETYILTSDHTAIQVMDALASAARRGVKTRLLVDGFGSSFWVKPHLDHLMAADAEVKIYHPLPWRFWEWKHSVMQHNWFNKLMMLFAQLNRRNHRKVCIVDETIVWLGSFNITRVHLKRSEGGENWSDTAIRVVTHDRSALHAFDKTWFHRRFRFKNRYINELSPFLINDTIRQRRYLHRLLISRIRRSQQRCWITNPYFVPESRLLKNLEKAARRGVDVRILVPERSDVFFIPWASSLLYPSLLRAGVKVYEFNDGILHSKTMIIDNWASVGTSNMNSRSVLHDLEIDYALQQQASREQLATHFLNELGGSKLISVNDLQKRNILTKILGRAVLFLRYWI